LFQVAIKRVLVSKVFPEAVFSVKIFPFFQASVTFSCAISAQDFLAWSANLIIKSVHEILS